MKLRNRVEKHVTNYPYEGEEVDYDGMESMIEDLLRRMINFSHKFTKTSKGYERDGKYYSKEQVLQMYLTEL